MDNRFIFRAWDTERQEMLYPKGYRFGATITESDFAINSDGTILGFMYAGRIQKRKNLISMLWSCYYDKNDEMIFQDDIVKILDVIAVVRWGDAQFYFECVKGDWCDDWNFPDDASRFEVIGNIYKNPELLNQ